MELLKSITGKVVDYKEDDEDERIVSVTQSQVCFTFDCGHGYIGFDRDKVIAIAKLMEITAKELGLGVSAD